MSKDLSLFHFNTAPIRVVDIDGAPWFVAADVCRALGLGVSDSGSAHSIGALDTDERCLVRRSTLGPIEVSFPNRGATCLSESGLYKLALRSDKKDAKPFQDWVTRTVLPAIRKDGAYVAGEEKVSAGEMSEDEFLLRAHEILMRKVERLTAENAAKLSPAGAIWRLNY